MGRRAFVLGSLGAATILPLRRGWAQQGVDPVSQVEPGAPVAAEAAPAPFGYDEVRKRARVLAETDYQDPGPLPEPLSELDDERRARIRYRPETALWTDESLFRVAFHHLGGPYQAPVRVNLVEQGEVVPLVFRRETFDYTDSGFTGDLPADLGFAGLKILFPLNQGGAWDEVLSFLGASYFRLLGRGQRYGLSARGLAVDTALSEGEDFPRFTEFWLEKPGPQSGVMDFYALLDSASITGAYRFRLRPGLESELEVQVTLYPRRRIEKMGAAPLTSMFLQGEARLRDFGDIRPEVHDSDGLLLRTHSGEWVWRPLTNPRALRISAFLDRDIQGFGLFQRDRDFENYQDIDAAYEQRPSFWVEPLGDWGPGRVELVEIPSDSPANDNIVAYWVPETPTAPGQGLELSYRLVALKGDQGRPPGGRVRATRIGASPTGDPERRHFMVDFEGAELASLDAGQAVTAEVSCASGQLYDIRARKVPATGGWRAVFDFQPLDEPSDLRCYLRLREDALSETWTYLWTP